jgi:GxxExxY protein
LHFDLLQELQRKRSLLPVHHAQSLTYMQLTDCPIGLLINFNAARLMEGVKRLVNPRATARTRSVRQP